MQLEFISSSSSFTRSLGKEFSRYLTSGDIILLCGELGGGKTTFISGTAEGLGISGNLSSPSFTILNEYQAGKKYKFIHADLYRIEDTVETETLGLDDHIYCKDTVVCVEWGDKIREGLRIDFLEIRFEYLIDGNGSGSRDQRRIIFISNNKYWDRKLQKFQKYKKMI